MRFAQSIIFWLLLPWCSGMNSEFGSSLFADDDNSYEELLDMILHDPITINGRQLSLEQLYMDPFNTVATLRPSEAVLVSFIERNDVIIGSLPTNPDSMGRIAYVKRQFLIRLASTDRLSEISPAHLVDTPTAFARQIASSTTPQVPLYLIGDAGTGKTVALAKIGFELHTLMPTHWIISLSTSLYVQVQELTLKNLVSQAVGAENVDVLLNLLEVNPRKIIFLFDNVDMMITRPSVVEEIIKPLVDKGVTIFMSGRAFGLEYLRPIIETIDICEIKEMTLLESESFLRAVWEREVTAQLADSARPSTSSAAHYSARLKTYTAVFTHTLFKTNLPRQPPTLTILADIFTKSNSRLILEKFSNRFSCLDYVFETPELEYNLPLFLENVVLDQTSLFEKFIQSIVGENDPLELFYSSVALANTVNAQELPMVASSILDSIQLRIDASRLIIVAHRTSARLVNIGHQNQIEFIHPEYQNYYAAKALTHPTIDSFILERFLPIPQYAPMLSFLDSQLLRKLIRPKISTLSQNEAIRVTAINNILSHGFEDLFLRTYEALLASEIIESLNNYLFHSTQKFLVAKKVFGLLRNRVPHPDPNPFDVLGYVEMTQNPMERIVDGRMLRVCKELLRRGTWYSPTEMEYYVFYHDLLKQAVERSMTNIELLKFCVEHASIEIPRDRLDDLLYHAVDRLGPYCPAAAEYLISLGAQPLQAAQRGQNLLHAAIRWNRASLVHYVLHNLNVPAVDVPDASGQTVFEAALDANPSPYHVHSSWWRMMLYLVENVRGLSITFSELSLDIKAQKIPVEDIESPWFQLMCMSEPLNLDPDILSVDIVQITRLETASDDYYSRLRRFVHFETTWPLSKQTLSIRRNGLLWSLRRLGVTNVGVLETMLYYRGVGIWHPLTHSYYRSILSTLFNQRNEVLPAHAVNRIMLSLCANIGEIDDFITMHRMVELFITEKLIKPEDRSYKNLIEKLELRLKESQRFIENSRLTSNTVSLLPRLVTSTERYRPDLNPAAAIKITRMLRYLRVSHHVYNLQGEKALLCLLRRSRRDAQLGKCFISWDDVDSFNEAILRRDVSRIHINSDLFLDKLAIEFQGNPQKAKQLVDLVDTLDKKSGGQMEIFKGGSKMLARHVIRQGGLSAYRKLHLTSTVLNNFWRSSGSHIKYRFSFPSRVAVQYGAMSIPLLRGLHVTIATCLQHTENPDRCWYASGALALSAGITVLSVTAGKFVPWLVNHFTQAALDFLPVAAPTVISQYIGSMRYLGLRYGVKTFGYALGIIGIGFDLFNIIQMSQMIDACSQPDSGCRDRDKAEYIIMLTFSCISIAVMGGLMLSGIGFVPALLIGLALLVLEQVTLGLSAVYYYSRDYHTTWTENLRIFWHKISLQSAPEDIQALEARADWTNNLQQQIEQQLEKSEARVVAYAVGLGVIGGSNVTAGYAFIDMENGDVKNTKILSRVRVNAQNWTTLLCSPRYNPNAPYEDWPTQSASSVYRCENAFVVGHKNRWEKRNDKSYIFYNLEHVSSGTIIGSNSVNNLFSIHNNDSALNIVGGNGNITNIYVIPRASITGFITLHGGMTRNILDFSAYDDIMNFQWFTKSGVGHVWSKNDAKKVLELNAADKSINLAVIGRSGEIDTFACGYSEKSQDVSITATSIVINGRGGQSFYNMDRISDCEKSMIHPSTHVVGGDSSELMYTAYVSLAPITTEEIVGKAVIDPRQSRFIITFINSPLFISTLHVRYKPKTDTLVWKLSYSNTQVLYLSILSYRSANLRRQDNFREDPINSISVNSVFIDGYFGTTVFPVIEIPANNFSATVKVTRFNIFGTMDKIQLKDVLKLYHSMQIMKYRNLVTVTKLTHAQTGQSFTFGSETNDRFYVDDNSTFLFGGNGEDVYALSRNSSRLVWIENEALDDALDTLIIPSAMCESLRAVEGSVESDCCRGSEDDVTLVCTLANSTSKHEIRVVLRSYLMDQRHRHLQIYWHDATHVLLLPEWISQRSQGDSHLPLGLFFDLAAWQSTMLTLTSSDNYLVLGVADSDNPVIAYSSGERDLVLATQFFNQDVSSFVLLQDFFADTTPDAIVSLEWERLMIFIVQGSVNNLKRAMNVSDILNLHYETGLDDGNQTDSDFIKEYLVNLGGGANENQTIIIEHNNSSLSDRDQIGVLALIGASSGPLQATWTDNGTSLSLRSLNTHIVVKDWCHTVRHRLHRIEWYRNYYDRPNIIRYLDHLQCPRKENLIRKITIGRLNTTLHAMYKIIIDSEHNDNDDAQLVRLFGFSSLNDQMHFFYNNCNVLLTESKLQTLSYNYTRRKLQKIIDDFLASNPSSEEIKSLNLLRNKFDTVSNECWQNFKNSFKSGNQQSFDLLNIVPGCA